MTGGRKSDREANTSVQPKAWLVFASLGSLALGEDETPSEKYPEAEVGCLPCSLPTRWQHYLLRVGGSQTYLTRSGILGSEFSQL